jgi:choice-of-anchor C domain-containing protein
MRAAAVIVLVCTSAAFGNILVNGSFEEGPDVPSPPGYLEISDGSTAIPGWVVKTPVPSSNIDRVSTYWQNSHGSYSIDLNGLNGPGGIAQGFGTVIGQTYYVTFDIASNPTVPSFAPVKTIEVIAAGQSQQFTADSTGHTLTEMGWETHTWSFVAQTTTTELWFKMIYPDYSAEGMGLDNVRVDVPEPATIATLVLGVLAVMRRRQR